MSVNVRLSRDSSRHDQRIAQPHFSKQWAQLSLFFVLAAADHLGHPTVDHDASGGGEPPDFILLVRQILLPSAHSQIGNYHKIRYDHFGSVYRHRTDYSKLRANMSGRASRSVVREIRRTADLNSPGFHRLPKKSGIRPVRKKLPRQRDRQSPSGPANRFFLLPLGPANYHSAWLN